MPVLLIVVGAGALSGCLFIPTFNATTGGRNVSGDVGEAGSRKPVAVGRARLVDVYRVLGAPQFATPDNRKVAYTWDVLNGYWVGLCFGPQTGKRALILEFDESGVLRSFARTEVNGNALYHEPFGPPPLPAGMQAVPAQSGPVLVPSSQPVTIPPASPSPPPSTAPSSPLPPDAPPYPTPPR